MKYNVDNYSVKDFEELIEKILSTEDKISDVVFYQKNHQKMIQVQNDTYVQSLIRLSVGINPSIICANVNQTGYEKITIDKVDSTICYLNNKSQHSYDLNLKSFMNKIQYFFVFLTERESFQGKIFIHKLSNFYLSLIKSDYNTIHKAIHDDTIDSLTEADLNYLRFNQINDDVCISIKEALFKSIIFNKIAGSGDSSLFNKDFIVSDSFETLIKNKLRKYKNMSFLELKEKFKIEKTSKQIGNILAIAMLSNGKSHLPDEFTSASISVRAIRIDGEKIKESLPFPAFEFMKINQEEWENSTLRSLLINTKFLFIIYKKSNDVYVYDDAKLWNLNKDLIDTEAKNVWMITKSVISSGDIIKEEKENYRTTNFPGSNQSYLIHVRPHARDSKDTYPLPIPDKKTGLNEYTKQCFWLNNTFIYEIIYGNPNNYLLAYDVNKITLIKSSLKSNIYDQRYFFKTIKKAFTFNDKNTTEKKQILKTLDFFIEDEVVYPTKFSKIYDALFDEVLKNSFYKKDLSIKSNSYKLAMDQLSKKNIIINCGENEYYTIKDFLHYGVEYNIATQMIKKLNELIKKQIKIFTVYQIFGDILPKTSIDELISVTQLKVFFDKVGIFEVKYQKYGLKTFNKDNGRELILKKIMNGEYFKKVYEIIADIKNQYGIDFQELDIERDSSKLNFYYAVDLKTVFKTKEDYYREVWKR